MKLINKIDITKIRKRLDRAGNAITPKKGKGVPYNRNQKHRKGNAYDD